MKFGLPISFMAHGVFVAAGLLAFSGKITPAPEARVIPVELFTIADISNVRAARKVETPEPEVNEPLITPPEIALPEPEIAEPEKLAEAPLPKPEPAEDKPEEAVPPKPETPAEPAKPKPLSLDDLQKLADKAKTKAPAADQKLLQTEQNRIEQAELDRAAVGAGDGLSTGYEDAIMRKVYRGWQIPAGAPNMEQLIVSVKVTIARDGRIETAQLSPESERRMRSDSFYKAAAESALRAVREADSFNFLPRDQYEKWRSVSLTFYPKDAPSIVPT